MPRGAGWRHMIKNCMGHDAEKLNLLRSLPENSEQAVAECLLRLSIPKEDRETFLTLLLTTLPSWAAYAKYRTEWAGPDAHPHPVTQSDYLALRIIITSLLWPEAKRLLEWHHTALKQSQPYPLEKIQQSETAYRLPLLEKLSAQPVKEPHTANAQLVFCIDVRSEPFRRALEATGDYQTFGFRRVFGIPVQITDGVNGRFLCLMPVLLSPKHRGEGITLRPSVL